MHGEEREKKKMIMDCLQTPPSPLETPVSRVPSCTFAFAYSVRITRLALPCDRVHVNRIFNTFWAVSRQLLRNELCLWQHILNLSKKQDGRQRYQATAYLQWPSVCGLLAPLASTSKQQPLPFRQVDKHQHQRQKAKAVFFSNATTWHIIKKKCLGKSWKIAIFLVVFLYRYVSWCGVVWRGVV